MDRAAVRLAELMPFVETGINRQERFRYADTEQDGPSLFRRRFHFTGYAGCGG
jgi:hypothetical protein